MSDRLYDFLNKLQRWLPLLGTAYLGICNIWGTPYGDEVNQTIIIIATLLAGTLEVANSRYNEAQKRELENREFENYEG